MKKTETKPKLRLVLPQYGWPFVAKFNNVYLHSIMHIYSTSTLNIHVQECIFIQLQLWTYMYTFNTNIYSTSILNIHSQYLFNFNLEHSHSTQIFIQLQLWTFTFNTNIYSTSTSTQIYIQLQVLRYHSENYADIFTPLDEFLQQYASSRTYGMFIYSTNRGEYYAMIRPSLPFHFFPPKIIQNRRSE